MLAVRVGYGGIAISLTNDSHVVPCDKDGDPKTFANSGTNIEVFSGGVPLDFVTSLPTPRVVGQWTVSASPSWNTGSTQVGTITSGGTSPERYAIVGDHTFEGEVGNGLNNTEIVTYTIVIPQEADNGAADLTLTKIQTFSLGLDGQTSTTPGPDGVAGDAGLREVTTLIYYQNGVSPNANGTYTAPSISTTNNNVATVFDFDTFSFTAGAPTNWDFSAPNFEPLDSNGDFYKYYAATMVAKEGYTADADGVKTGTGDTSGTDGSISFINVRQTIAFQGLVTFSGRSLKWDAGDYEFNYTAIDGAWITTGKITGPNLGYLNTNAGTTSTDANGVVTTTSGPASLAVTAAQTYTSSGMEIDFLNGRILSPNFFINPDVAQGDPTAGIKGELEVQGSSTVTGNLTVGTGTGSVTISGSGQRIVITDSNSTERVILGKLS